MPEPTLADVLLYGAGGAGGNFGTMTPQEEAVAVTPGSVLDTIAGRAATLPQRAFQASENLRQGGTSSDQPAYDPAPAVETAGYMLGGAPFAEKGALGAAGGKMITPRGGIEAGEDILRSPIERVGGPARPAIISPDAPLFDYSRLGEIPSVPQFELPRYNPPRGVSERVGELVQNPQAQQAVASAIDRGLSVGAEKFYNQQPLLEEFQSELGAEQGAKDFKRFVDYESATSPRSKVPENVRNASYYYVRDKQGNIIKPWEEDPGQPAPYGHMAQKLQRQGAIDVQQGTWDPIKNPKPPSYGENLSGNLMPGTIDAHAFNLPAMSIADPRFLKGSYKPGADKPTINPAKMYASGELSMEQALKQPAFWAGMPNANEYAAMEQFWRNEAAKKGLATGQGQAAGWTGGGELTGNMSSSLEQPDPILKVFEDRVRLTAQKERMTPRAVMQSFIRGQMPLISGAGVAAGLGSTLEGLSQRPQGTQ